MKKQQLRESLFNDIKNKKYKDRDIVKIIKTHEIPNRYYDFFLSGKCSSKIKTIFLETQKFNVEDIQRFITFDEDFLKIILYECFEINSADEFEIFFDLFKKTSKDENSIHRIYLNVLVYSFTIEDRETRRKTMRNILSYLNTLSFNKTSDFYTISFVSIGEKDVFIEGIFIEELLETLQETGVHGVTKTVITSILKDSTYSINQNISNRITNEKLLDLVLSNSNCSLETLRSHKTIVKKDLGSMIYNKNITTYNKLHFLFENNIKEYTRVVFKDFNDLTQQELKDLYEKFSEKITIANLFLRTNILWKDVILEHFGTLVSSNRLEHMNIASVFDIELLWDILSKFDKSVLIPFFGHIENTRSTLECDVKCFNKMCEFLDVMTVLKIVDFDGYDLDIRNYEKHLYNFTDKNTQYIIENNITLVSTGLLD